MWTLIDQLVSQGVTDFFFAAGSRSTPLVLAAANHPKITLHRHFDERGLGFYALGMAIAKEAPVAVIVTSGSAVGNLMPAVMEADHAQVPLILLTADRPAELRECSSNQTTDQSRLFSRFVRWQFEIDPSMPKEAVRSQATQAVFQASCQNPGPVHINCPLREPLYRTDFPIPQQTPIKLQNGEAHLITPQALPSKGVILVGRLPKRSDIDPVLELAERLQWPVFADILSGARSRIGGCQIRYFDWFLQQEKLPQPSTILHFGERLTSKRVMEWVSRVKPNQYIHVSPFSRWNDPYHLMTHRIQASIASVCKATTNDPDSSWFGQWQDLDQETSLHIDKQIHKSWTESKAICCLAEWIEGPLFLGSSMPIREANWFLFPKQAGTFFCNRGLSGIDGNIATALGVAKGLQKPLVAVVGDLTALHDLNSISLLQTVTQPVKLVISNNGGGGIFSHLAVAKDPRFGELFAFEHTLSFERVAQMFSLPYEAVHSEKELLNAMQRPGTVLIELFTSRKENILFHKQLLASLDTQTTSKVGF